MDYYFDVTTWVLINRTAKDLTRSTRVLDMGTGSVAVVGLTIWKRLGCSVISSDINPEIVQLAEECARRNGAPIRTVCSRFFENVHEPFDVVIFNPPYVATAHGLELDDSRKRRCQWDGGSDGTSIIRDFVVGLQALPHQVRAYVGVNPNPTKTQAARARACSIRV